VDTPEPVATNTLPKRAAPRLLDNREGSPLRDLRNPLR